MKLIVDPGYDGEAAGVIDPGDNIRGVRGRIDHNNEQTLAAWNTRRGEVSLSDGGHQH